ncbi:MAG: PQQ-binding-like beta-propeller repeat protein [Thermoguttaceae bacterium]|jgi:outer membrane protein assembly factor BamB|nr:PQQ-binding-like beta-propeller repeat protein [Thermoguttaceae bacterium]
MLRTIFLPLLFAVAVTATAGFAEVENWPGWRGPRGDGTSLEKNVPLRWEGQSMTNVAWRTPVPGRSHSSPIVWDDKVLLSTCLEDEEERALVCFDRRTGNLLWQRTVIKAPLERLHRLNSYASGTPATDGRLVYVAYLEPDFANVREVTPGSIVVAAYHLDGRREWLVRPGRFSSVHGFCTSPVLFEDLVIINGDHDGDSFIFGLDKRTGETVWQTPREHKTRSYCTPIIREIDGRTQMVFSGSKCVVSLDPRDGSQHWIIGGPTEQFVASLVYNGKYFFLTAGFPEHHILAIRPNGRGDVTDTHIVWRTTRGCSYVPSPIVEGDYFLVASDNGIVSCFEVDTGHRHWMVRMAPHYSSSAVSAEGLVYFTDDNGTTKVIRPGPDWELVAENELGENCYSSPAISQGQIFVRGEQHLYCIGGEERE